MPNEIIPWPLPTRNNPKCVGDFRKARSQWRWPWTSWRSEKWFPLRVFRNAERCPVPSVREDLSRRTDPLAHPSDENRSSRSNDTQWWPPTTRKHLQSRVREVPPRRWNSFLDNNRSWDCADRTLAELVEVDGSNQSMNGFRGCRWPLRSTYSVDIVIRESNIHGHCSIEIESDLLFEFIIQLCRREREYTKTSDPKRVRRFSHPIWVVNGTGFESKKDLWLSESLELSSGWNYARILNEDDSVYRDGHTSSKFSIIADTIEECERERVHSSYRNAWTRLKRFQQSSPKVIIRPLCFRVIEMDQLDTDVLQTILFITLLVLETIRIDVQAGSFQAVKRSNASISVSGMKTVITYRMKARMDPVVDIPLTTASIDRDATRSRCVRREVQISPTLTFLPPNRCPSSVDRAVCKRYK